MCGIVGYVGKKPAKGFLIEGLKRLEYRGYDSAGIAVFENQKSKIKSRDPKNRMRVVKSSGKVVNLEKKIPSRLGGCIGIAHTRWATHGKPSEKNAHPHTDCSKSIAVVHNGIIENYRELKEELERKGHRFRSETDTEVIAHLIEEEYKQGKKKNFESAFGQAVGKLQGAYGIVALSADEPEKLFAARLSSPLVIGIGREGISIASDVSAMSGDIRKVVYLDDHEQAVLESGGFSVKAHSGKEKKKKSIDIDLQQVASGKGEYPHFMLKEIFEQPQTFADALRGRLLLKETSVRLGGLKAVEKKLRLVNRIVIVSCGTSYHSGLVAEYMIEELARIPTEVETASEFRYRKPILDKRTAVIVVSQSGETADTLAALREAKRQGALTIGIVNVVGSSIARETDAGIYCHAGPEVSVASTKAFTSQLAIFSLMALFLAKDRGLPKEKMKKIVRAIENIPEQMEEILKEKNKIKAIAKKYAKVNHFMYLGRTYNFPLALEGALKIKEIAYVPAQGYPTGEMKHGPIALIDHSMLTVSVVPRDSMYEKNMSGIEEIRARGGSIFALATDGDNGVTKKATDVFFLPKTIEMLSPILAAIPLQLFAYYVALERGYDIDTPRNLAKSVTVE